MKLFKYLFLVNLFKKAKKHIVIAGGMLLLLMVSTFLMNDFILVATGSEKYLFLLIKWLLILVYMIVIAYNFLKIFNVATTSVSLKPQNEVVLVQDDKKDRILAKEHLTSKSDQIMEKYMKGSS